MCDIDGVFLPLCGIVSEGRYTRPVYQTFSTTWLIGSLFCF